MNIIKLKAKLKKLQKESSNCSNEYEEKIMYQTYLTSKKRMNKVLKISSYR